MLRCLEKLGAGIREALLDKFIQQFVGISRLPRLAFAAIDLFNRLDEQLFHNLPLFRRHIRDFIHDHFFPWIGTGTKSRITASMSCSLGMPRARASQAILASSSNPALAASSLPSVTMLKARPASWTSA